MTRIPLACALSGLVLLTLFACGDDAASPPAGGTPDAEAGTIVENEDSGSQQDSGADTSAPNCRVVKAPAIATTVNAAAVAEASGVAVSTKNAGVYWVHNDSGDSARAFAINADGSLAATLAYDAAFPTDVEDMAIEDQGGGTSFLYFADFGDNPENRANIVIHRIAEPSVAGGGTITVTSEKMTVTYADGPHNAETLLFDPISKDLYIATKKTGGPSAIHRIGAFAAGSATTTAVGSVPIALATGGEISRDGSIIAIRSYTTAFVWKREAGETVAAALARAPCEYPMIGEPQGESLAFVPDGSGYVTLSEGASPPIRLHAFQ